MIDGALPYLRCPVCEQTLGRCEQTLRCPHAHSFDTAKQGYADLTAGRLSHVGDTAEMVADRAGFLAAGHYDFIADALVAAASAPSPTLVLAAPQTPPTAPPGTSPGVAPGRSPGAGAGAGLVVDAGTGTGHYLARFLAAAPAAVGLGLDVAKPALRRAAKAHPRAAAVRCDLWRPLPVVAGSAAVVLNVFAPRNGAEFHRILRPDGVLLVVTPAPDHLQELIEAHGLIHVDPDKAARVNDSLGVHFEPLATTTSRRTMRLTAAAVRTLIGMTPSAHHVPTGALPLTETAVTAAVDITAYGRRGSPGGAVGGSR